MIDTLNSLEHFNKTVTKEPFYILAFYSEGSEKSKEALKTLQILEQDNTDTPFYAVNATQVKDIHPQFGVNSVPTVLAIKDGRVVKNIQGTQTRNHYEMLLYDAPLKANSEGKIRHSVVVYTTPTCSWCNTLKSYLRQNKVMFREVDVSRDQHAAEEIVRRSGQTGVPQTDIDGQMVVGFDQTKMNRLLGLKQQ